MNKERVTNLILRLLAAGIDFILILVPMYVISLFIFDFSYRASELYAQFVFLIYNVLLIDWLKGQTLGKKIGRLHVTFEEGEKTPLIKKGIREVSKLLYFLPIIGLFFCVVSLVIYLIKGKFLHDVTGTSKVILEKNLNDEVNVND